MYPWDIAEGSMYPVGMLREVLWTWLGIAAGARFGYCGMCYIPGWVCEGPLFAGRGQSA
jgi:hypothetical protein